jgi:hypothetical protein
MMADYAHVVFDIGPKSPASLRQAMRLSDDLVVPVAPSTGELRELPKTFELAAEADAVDFALSIATGRRTPQRYPATWAAATSPASAIIVIVISP